MLHWYFTHSQPLTLIFKRFWCPKRFWQNFCHKKMTHLDHSYLKYALGKWKFKALENSCPFLLIESKSSFKTKAYFSFKWQRRIAISRCGSWEPAPRLPWPVAADRDPTLFVITEMVFNQFKSIQYVTNKR